LHLDAELTDLDYEHFQLEGYAITVATMSIGTLTLDPINFNVSSGLWGLRGLQGLVSIDGVDVLGGTKDALSLGTNVTIVNPSNLNLGVGDLGMYSGFSKCSKLKDDCSIQSSNCSRTAR
jgi:hypothetical protein